MIIRARQLFGSSSATCEMRKRMDFCIHIHWMRKTDKRLITYKLTGLSLRKHWKPFIRHKIFIRLTKFQIHSRKLTFALKNIRKMPKKSSQIRSKFHLHTAVPSSKLCKSHLKIFQFPFFRTAPGPADYSVRPLVGFIDHSENSRRPRAPQWSIGQKLGTRKTLKTPGPASYDVKRELNQHGRYCPIALSIPIKFKAQSMRFLWITLHSLWLFTNCFYPPSRSDRSYARPNL